MEPTKPINYNVPIPRLQGMTEEQRAKALENYMREQTRQIRLILTRLSDMVRNIEETVKKEAQTDGE